MNLTGKNIFLLSMSNFFMNVSVSIHPHFFSHMIQNFSTVSLNPKSAIHFR